jgi:hypothetical protein
MKNNCQPVKIHSRYDKQHQYSNLISYETCGHIKRPSLHRLANGRTHDSTLLVQSPSQEIINVHNNNRGDKELQPEISFSH